MKFLKLILVVALLCALVSCGKESPSIILEKPQVKQTPIIEWADSVEHSLTVGESVLISAVVKNTEQQITYSISDTAIAEFTAPNTLLALAAGKVTLTAHVQETERFLADSISQTITVQNIAKAEPTLQWSGSSVVALSIGDAWVAKANVDNTEQVIKYSIDSEQVAQLNGLNTLLGLAPGEAILTASVSESPHFQSKSISRVIKVLKSNDATFRLNDWVSQSVNESLSNTIVNYQGTAPISYRSDDDKIAVVSSDGAVTALAFGETTIRAQIPADDVYSAVELDYQFIVRAPLNAQFTKSEPIEIQNQTQFQNSITSDSSDLLNPNYLSSDSLIAEVNSEGLVTFLQPGTVTISALIPVSKTYEAARLSYQVTLLKPQEVKFLSLNTSLKLGDFNIIELQRMGNGDIAIHSSREDVLAVKYSGASTYIEAVNYGSSIITATILSDGEYEPASVFIEVNVYAPRAISFEHKDAQRADAEGQVKNTASVNVGGGVIHYSTADESIATVDQSGVVSFVGYGPVTIKAEIPAHDIHAPAQVSYRAYRPGPGQKITFAEGNLLRTQHKSNDIVNRATALDNAKITYSTGDSTIAAVTFSHSASVSPRSAGVVDIIATSQETEKYLSSSNSYQLIVVGPQKITFKQRAPSEVSPGQIFQTDLNFEYEVTPISYHSSNEQVAIINQAGELKILDVGAATITAVAEEGYYYLGDTLSFDIKSRATLALEFEQQGTLVKQTGQQWQNRAIPSTGNLPVSYSSSNPEVVSVDEFGFATALKNGNATLLATVEETENHAQVIASYYVEIENQATTMKIKGKIGPTQSRFNFTGPATASLYRSSDYDCDLNALAFCEDAEQIEVTDQDWNDSVTTLTHDGHFQIIGATEQKTVTVGGYGANPKLDDGVEFNGRYWSVSSPFEPEASIWSTSDTRHWRREAELPWANNRELSAFVYDERLWLLVYAEDGNSTQSLWNSVDGQNWNKIAEQFFFPQRLQAQFIEFNGLLWMFGGKESGSFKTDVWSSSNGITWQLKQEDLTAGNNELSQALKHAVVHEGELSVYGSVDALNTSGFGYYRWSTNDGINWSESVEKSVLGSGCQFESKVYYVDESFWVLSCNENNNYYSQAGLWKSENGTQWQRISNIDLYGIKDFIHLNDRWYCFLDYAQSLRSITGEVWEETPIKNELLFASAYNSNNRSSFAEFKSRLWFVDVKGELYSTADGFQWRFESTIPQRTSMPESENELIVFDNALWLFPIAGGIETIWSSADGKTWQPKRSGDLPFIGDNLSNPVVFNQKLWLIDNYKNIWKSENGVDWSSNEKIDLLQPFDQYSFTLFNDELWFIGHSYHLNQDETGFSIFNTLDGENWQPHPSTHEFLNISNAELVNFEGLLWLISDKGIWQTQDGTDWQQVDIEESVTAIWHQEDIVAQVYQNSIWLIAGGLTEQKALWNSANGEQWQMLMSHQLEVD